MSIKVSTAKAAERFRNYKEQPIELNFHPTFQGTFESLGVSPDRRTPSGVRAAIIVRRERMVSAKWRICSTLPASM